MKKIQMQASLSILLLLISGFLSHTFAQNHKEVKKFTKDIDMQGAKAVNVEITQGAGTLNVSGGAGKLMEGQFAFTKEEWKPEVSYQQDHSKLLIKQPGNNRNINMEDGDRNEWQIRLNNGLPMEMELTLGAGQSMIDLHGMKLSGLLLKAGAGDFTVNLANTSLPRLKVNAGVGAMKIDLSGKWNNNLSAEINGGIGEITLKLPRKTGARVKVSGFGSIEAAGFKKEGGYYVNEAYNTTKTSLTIEVSGGLGSVNLELE